MVLALTCLYFIAYAAPKPTGMPSPMKANPPSCQHPMVSIYVTFNLLPMLLPL
jgi:hypothetical protein